MQKAPTIDLDSTNCAKIGSPQDKAARKGAAGLDVELLDPPDLHPWLLAAALPRRLGLGLCRVPSTDLVRMT